MHEAVVLVLDAAAGALLGSLYFGGLWWTIRKIVVSNRAGLWLLASLVVRSTMTVTGFLLVSGGHWPALLACLAGFLVARASTVRLSRSFPEALCAPQP
jgi:F1F0 ATPase subunit 2